MDLSILFSAIILPKLIILFILLIFSAIFSSTETAFTSLSVVQISQLAEKSKRGRLIKKLTDKWDNLLTTLLLGNNLVNIAATSIATEITISLWGENAVTAMTFFMTAIILIFSELTPKRIAIANNELIAKLTVYFVFLLFYLLFPVVVALRFICNILSWPFAKKKNSEISTEGILHLVDMAEDIGEIEEYENSMVKNVFQLSELPISAVMTHRKDVFCLDETTTLSDAYESIKEANYSRIPVFSGERENLVGIVLIKDIWQGLLSNQGSDTLSKYKHKPIFISEAKKADDVVKIFKDNQLKMAIVLDEYGGLSGIVTQEDVIEEIFGELYDEDEKAQEELILKKSENCWIVKGLTTLHQIESDLEISLPESRFSKTLGGFIMEHNNDIPNVGLILLFENIQFKVLSMDKNKIIDVEITKKGEQEAHLEN